MTLAWRTEDAMLGTFEAVAGQLRIVSKPATMMRSYRIPDRHTTYMLKGGAATACATLHPGKIANDGDERRA